MLNPDGDWKNKVQTVLGLNLLCATDYLECRKGAKLPLVVLSTLGSGYLQ